jgi:hypothetical protein
MSKVHDAGKGSEPRAVDQEGWDSCPLWDNLKRKKEMPKITLKPVLMVDACDFTDEVEEYCVDSEISTHYDWGSTWCELEDEDDKLCQWIVEHAKGQNFDLSNYIKDGGFRVVISPT